MLLCPLPIFVWELQPIKREGHGKDEPGKGWGELERERRLLKAQKYLETQKSSWQRGTRESEDEGDRKRCPECPEIYKIIKQRSHLLVAQMVKNIPAMQETQVPSLGRDDPLEKGMATYSSILTWEISWT